MPNANAWPANNGPAMPIKPDRAVSGVGDIAAWITQQCTAYQQAIASGNVSASMIINMYSNFYAWNATLTQYAAIPNVVAYALTQLGGSFDVVGSFNAMQASLVAAENWIGANFPAATAISVGGQGQMIYENFTSSSLAPLTSLITTLQATVN